MDGGRLLLGAAVAALTACSPGFRDAAPAPTAMPTATVPAASPSATNPLAAEESLRAETSLPPSELRGALERSSVRAGAAYRVTGTSDCGILDATLDLAGDAEAPATVRVGADGAFTVDGTVPRGTPPQTARVLVSTGCGPAETAAALSLTLRVTA